MCVPVCLSVCLCLEEKISKAIVEFVTKRIVFAGKEFFIDYLLIYDEIGFTGSMNQSRSIWSRG